MSGHLDIIVTGDGSSSLLNKKLDETYHSRHGARRESLHVFIENGLQFFHNSHPDRSIRIFEMGFGTGLNAWLAKQWSIENNIHLTYTAVESSPLPSEIYERLNYTSTSGEREQFLALHNCPWECVNSFDNFSFLKLHAFLHKLAFAADTFDVIFYDAFAPNKQPEMWTTEVLSAVTSWLTKGGVFVTYCAKGQLKRDLKNLGLTVETLAGPPGKKEMVRALRN